ncbi:MAG: zinc ribbon domain-containing protein [Bacteroidales bacterium]|nr:zinc ribbon domain-containing protein [Bacteroidales bacterium]MCF8458871.1 zinc ribbon domain-containing protein [Bacteroidales bacterium]
MAFPVSKQAKIEFEMAEGLSSDPVSVRDIFFDHLSNADIDKLQKQEDKISFISKNSLFRVPYEISLGFKIEEKLIVDYEIRLTELLKLCVLFAILIAFFTRLQLEYFVMLFVITITSFYFLNILIVENSLKNMLQNVFQKTGFSSKDSLEGEQQTWMDDASRCPACGEFVGEFENKCPSCKLSLPTRKQGHKYYKPYLEKSTEPTIHYDYKEKKK